MRIFLFLICLLFATNSFGQVHFSPAIKAAYNLKLSPGASDPITSVPVFLFNSTTGAYTLPSSDTMYLSDSRVTGFKVLLPWQSMEPAYHVFEWQIKITSALTPVTGGATGTVTNSIPSSTILAVGDILTGCGAAANTTVTSVNLPNFSVTPSQTISSCQFSVINPNSPLQQLKNDINATAGQQVGFGVDAGVETPAWLGSNCSTCGVPFPQNVISDYPSGGAFFVGGFDAGTQNQCSQYLVPISWDANFVSEYNYAVDQLIAYLHSTYFTGTTITMLSKLRILVMSGMVVEVNEESGVPYGGCSGTITVNGNLYNIDQTPQDTAAILLDSSRVTNSVTSAVDLYSQSAVLTAYENIVSHMRATLNSYGSETSQTYLKFVFGETNCDDWPYISKSGTIESTCGNDILLTDNIISYLINNKVEAPASICYDEMSLATSGQGSPPVPTWYIHAAQNGLYTCGQNNGNATRSGNPGGNAITSCRGKNDGVIATPACVAATWALYEQPAPNVPMGTLKHVEVRGNDFLYRTIPSYIVLP